MRGILLLATLAFLTTFAAGAAHAGGIPEVCITIDGEKTACAYNDGPVWLLCADVEGRTVACIPDPCGTTSCW